MLLKKRERARGRLKSGARSTDNKEGLEKQFFTSYDKNQIDFLCSGGWKLVRCYGGLLIVYMRISVLQIQVRAYQHT